MIAISFLFKNTDQQSKAKDVNTLGYYGARVDIR